MVNGNIQTPAKSMRGAGSVVAGVLQAALGLAFVLAGVAVGLSTVYPGGYTPWQFVSLLLLLCGTGLLLRGVGRCRLYSLGQRVDALVRGKPREHLSMLTRATGCDHTRLIRDLRELSARKYFPGAYVDLNRQEFVLQPGGPQPPLAQEGTRLQENAKAPAGPVYLFGYTWLLCALLLPMYRLPDLLVAAALSLLTALAARRAFPKRILITEIAYQAPAPKPVEKINTGNEELDEVLSASIQPMNDLIALERSITDEKMQKRVRNLVRICTQIFDYIKKTPDKLREIRQFLNYYLPTTIKLLKNYEELSRQPVKGDNIKQAMTKIEETILIIQKAFEKELDSLYADKAMDITVDIEVLENMMQQEGLTASSLDNIRTGSR